jgi:BON domain-containing protein
MRGVRCASADSITEKTVMGNRLVLAVAVLSIFFAMGCARKTDDAAIVTNIQSRMFSDPQLKGADLKVTSDRGAVTLSGSVPNDAARLDAYKLALQAAGVTKVNDRMSVESARPASIASTVAPSGSTSDITDRKSVAPAVQPRRPSPPLKPVKTPDVALPMQGAVLENPTLRTPPPEIEANALPPSPPSSVVPVVPPAPAPLPQPKNVVIPATSTVSIRMIDSIDSKVNHSGEVFHASLDAPLVVGDSVVVPRGADVYVRLASASSAGHFKGKSELHLELVKMDFQGRSYDLASDTYTEVGSSRGANTAKKVGGGAIAGALLGGLLGGGKGAAIGAGVGAGGGAVYQGATKGKQVQIPAETKLDFQLSQPVTVTVMPRADIPTE